MDNFLVFLMGLIGLIIGFFSLGEILAYLRYKKELASFDAIDRELKKRDHYDHRGRK